MRPLRVSNPAMAAKRATVEGRAGEKLREGQGRPPACRRPRRFSVPPSLAAVLGRAARCRSLFGARHARRSRGWRDPEGATAIDFADRLTAGPIQEAPGAGPVPLEYPVPGLRRCFVWNEVPVRRQPARHLARA